MRRFGGDWTHQSLSYNMTGCLGDTKILVGGWTNPFEKYARQIGSFPQGSGVKIKHVWNHQPAGIYAVLLVQIPRDPITLSDDDWGVESPPQQLCFPFLVPMKNGNPKTSWLEWSNFWSLQKISVFPVGKIWIVCSGNFAWIHGWNPVKRSCIFWIRFVSCTSVFFLDMLAKITMIGSDPWTKKIFRMGSFRCSTNFWYMFHEFPHVCKEGLLPYHHLLNKWLQGCIFRGIPTKWARKKKRPYFPGYSVFNRDPYLKKQPIIAMELGRGFIPYIHKKPPGFFIELLKCCFFFLSVGNISHPTP